MILDENDPFAPYAPGMGSPQQPAQPGPDSPPTPIDPNGPIPGHSHTNPAYQDLAWWKHFKGVTPDQIFGPDGQLLPGWSRTAKGYERIDGGGGNNTGNTGLVPAYNDPIWKQGGGPGGYDPFAAGSFGGNAPMLGFPDYESPGAFDFDPFTPSSWADAENEPGYKASRDLLRKQVEAGAAYRGMVRSGMTIGDLYSNLDALGQQNFGQFDDRRFRNWMGNRDLALTKFDRRATDIDRKNNYRFNVADASFKDALARWTAMTQSLTSMATAGANS